MKFIRLTIFAVIALVIIYSLSFEFQSVHPLARSEHAAVLLPDGRVLVLGGTGRHGPVLNLQSNSVIGWCDDHLPESLFFIWNETVISRNNCQYFNPKTNEWSNGGDIPYVNSINAAAILPNGQVIAGDFGKGDEVLNGPPTIIVCSDAAIGRWTRVPEPVPHEIHGTTTPGGYVDRIQSLSRGRVLITSPIQSALYNSATAQWTPVESAPLSENLVQIDDNRVFATGNGRWEILDLKSGKWSPSTPMAPWRYRCSVALLPNGKLLEVGGIDSEGSGTVSCQLFDCNTGKWTPTGSSKAPHYNCSLILLKTGKILAIGGVEAGSGPVCELYDPATGNWTTTGGIDSDRSSFTATLLQNGRVFIFGGSDNMGTKEFATAEIYDPATEKWTEVN